MKVVQFAPRGFDYSSNQITEGMHLLSKEGEIEFMCTHKVVHHGAKITDLRVCSESEAVLRAYDWADIIICSSGGDYKFMEGHSGLCFKTPTLAEKLVFIDGHDSDQFLADPEMMRLYLKREARYPTLNSLIWRNVRSFQFGVYDFHLEQEQPGFDDRDIDISFVAFGGSNSIREKCAQVIKRAEIQGFFRKVYVDVAPDKQPLPIDEYRDIMRRSKFIVSVQGAGLDTLRFWEAMGFGAVLCSIDVGRMMHVRHMPEPMRHCLLFDSFGHMVELMRHVVSDPVRWGDMRAATDRLIRCHHTTKARARQLIELFKEISCHPNFSSRFAKPSTLEGSKASPPSKS